MNFEPYQYFMVLIFFLLYIFFSPHVEILDPSLVTTIGAVRPGSSCLVLGMMECTIKMKYDTNMRL
jgi:hypothetical protein